MPTEEQAKQSLQQVVMTAYFNSCIAKAIEQGKSCGGAPTAGAASPSQMVKTSGESQPLIADPAKYK
ncbi:hypothetical protein PRIPAC_71030 [Pristionchus pacificus]|uniref:Uncharacterized protein n=1 Tax=Pristionchus pacificus TaxID=54126 RepID=A0A2A6C6L1_PRIPA|nr:hypothetical protein PRIPAC_71030 [Pristionchus pacificus]|eukprot:PDM73708.1 hypothetical protein PRIPAC_41064 [Pristionchus pacificus]